MDEEVDPVALRRSIEALSTEVLIEALARRDDGAWRPEGYELIEAVLRERGVAIDQAVAAVRATLPQPLADATLVPVTRSFNPTDAELIRMRLEAAGITAQLADKNVAALHFGYAVVVGGVKVLVRPEDADA